MWELGWKNKARPQRTFFLPVLTVTLCMHVYVWMTPGLKAVSVWSIWQSSNSAVTLINIWVQMYTTHCQLLIEVTQLNHSYIHSQQMKLFEIFSLLLVFHCHNGNYCLAGRQNPWNINWETDEDKFKAQIDNWIILKNPVFSGYSRDLLKDLYLSFLNQKCIFQSVFQNINKEWHYKSIALVLKIRYWINVKTF